LAQCRPKLKTLGGVREGERINLQQNSTSISAKAGGPRDAASRPSTIALYTALDAECDHKATEWSVDVDSTRPRPRPSPGVVNNRPTTVACLYRAWRRWMCRGRTF